MDALAAAEANARLYTLRVLLGAVIARLPARDLPTAPIERVRRERELVLAAMEVLDREAPGATEPLAEAARQLIVARKRLVASDRIEHEIETIRVDALARLARRCARPVDAIGPAGALARTASRSEPVALWGSLLDTAAGATAWEDPWPEPVDARRPSITSERDAPNVGVVERIRMDMKESEASVLIHTFEKIDTADEHRGGARDLDGSDELDEHFEALSEVPIGKVIRTRQAAASLLRTDADVAGDIPDFSTVAPDEKAIPYDEWSFRERAYRRGWCAVYPTKLPIGDGRWAENVVRRRRGLIEEAHRRLTAQRSKRRACKRQLDGDDVDVDAVVDHLAALAAGHAVAAKLYVRRPRTLHALSTTILIDLSMSADAWIDNRRVLDVSREAVVVLGEVAARLGDCVQILGFASHTRNHCRVFDVLRSGEPWSQGKARIGALRPQGYTRMGPALRHATAETLAEDARRRLVLVVTDGRPTDYDKYEGRYGVEDVRQAVREAEAAGVSVHSLAIDTVARAELAAMFGPGRWDVLPRVEELPRALTALYARLAAR